MSSNGHGHSPSHEAPAAANVVHPQTWHDIIDAYVVRSHENKSDLSALLIDIDALKAANDELGHDAGNKIIEAVDRITSVVPSSVRGAEAKKEGRTADLVMSHPSELRTLDIPGLALPEPRSARIGGDEFGIILPDTDRSGANVVANRLREAVTDELKLPENRFLAEVGVGVSIGVATLEPGMTASDLLRFADQAMYNDKLKRLRELSPQEEAAFITAIEHLEKAGVRPRDVPKYLQMLGASAVTRAFESQADSAQLDS